MAQRAKKQHFVPRFYLSRFCDLGGNVWNYTPTADVHPRQPEDTAVESNFYSPVVEGGARYDEVEELLAKIESDAAPLWDQVLVGKVMAGDDREKSSMFVAAQYLRSPAVRSRV